jgi:hypothetical protein
LSGSNLQPPIRFRFLVVRIGVTNNGSSGFRATREDSFSASEDEIANSLALPFLGVFNCRRFVTDRRTVIVRLVKETSPTFNPAISPLRTERRDD